MIDKDDSGTLDKAEVVDAVKNDKKVIKFLCNCGNQNLQYLLVPSRLDKALAEMDTDRDGTIDCDEWEQCIEIALQNKLAARAAKRELDAKNAAKEIAAFTSDFLNAARKCFNLIDKDMSGTLEIDEIVTHVFILMCIALLGAALNELLNPIWIVPVGREETAMYARYLIAWPVAIILSTLALQQSLHIGVGRATRRIGKRRSFVAQLSTGAAKQ